MRAARKEFGLSNSLLHFHGALLARSQRIPVADGRLLDVVTVEGGCLVVGVLSGRGPHERVLLTHRSANWRPTE